MDESRSTYHLYVVVALEVSIAVGAVVMRFNLMLFATFLIRVRLVAKIALIEKVVCGVHVLTSGGLRVEEPIASVTLEGWTTMTSCIAMHIPCSPAGWELFSTRTALILVIERHFAGRKLQDVLRCVLRSV